MEKTKLPSGRGTLTLRYMTVGDIMRLYSASVSGADQDVVEVIMDTIVKSKFPADTITYNDYIYLMWWHRFKSFPTTPIEIVWTCNSGVRRRDTVSYQDLIILQNKKRFTQYTTSKKQKLKAHIPTIKDYLELLEHGVLEDATSLNQQSYELFMDLMSVKPDDVDTKAYMDGKVNDILSPDDQFKIRKKLKAYKHGVASVVHKKCVCPGCKGEGGVGTDNVIQVIMNTNKFFPNDSNY